MSTNICGNCESFRPKKGERFFNCTRARHAGVSYGMQVRADTRSCDAFTPFKPSPAPTPSTAPRPASRQTKQARVLPAEGIMRPLGLCRWGKAVLIIALVIAILVFSWITYTCATKTTSTPTPTPTIGPGPTSTKLEGPTPTPTPAYILQYADLGADNFVKIPGMKMVSVHSPSLVTSYRYWTGQSFSSPPGTKFLFIYVQVYNRSSTTPFTILASDFVIVDSDGIVYGAAGQPYYVMDGLESKVLQPGDSAGGAILYVVPNVASGFEVSYLLDPYSTPPVFARWILPW